MGKIIMRESAIEKKVCAYAKEKGFIVYKMSGMNQKGQPDRLFLKKGVAFFIEFKAPGKKVTKLQAYHLNRIADQGFPTAVVDNIEKGMVLLDALDKRFT